jgi:hypothetical protein
VLGATDEVLLQRGVSPLVSEVDGEPDPKQLEPERY